MKNKNQIITAVLLITLCACKTRHVTTELTNLVDKSVTTQVAKQNVVQLDTTRTQITFQAKKRSRDSFEIEITPDTGSIRIVKGNYWGKAKSIRIKGASQSQDTYGEMLQQNKGMITKTILADSTTINNNIKSSQFLKKTKSSLDTPFLLTVISIIIFLIIFFLIKNKF